MKRKIIVTMLIIFSFTLMALPNRNIAEGKCTCPLSKYHTGLSSKCPGAQMKEAADIVPMGGLIHWL
jgi:hypothetical protein